MSIDTILAIVALALCIGQVVAARSKERRTTVIVGLTLSVAAIIVFSLIRRYTEEAVYQASLADAERDVVAQAKTPSTFDDIYSQVYYIQFDLVNDAIDHLVASNELLSSKVIVTDSKGATHTVRLFFSRPPT